MPPNTADAADAFSSVRREKLIGFLPWGYFSCDDPDVASHQRTRALIAASARGGNTGFGGSGLLGPNERLYSRRAGLVC